ncbi:hypothetical protein [Halorhodospira sp. 9622]|uniref:PFGI-1 class ICE element type IV pilus protein PilL2 n=1 Tax=Halorhodospira sp. 9622 TaxID=2899136 RepID=UPI001EE7BCA5|nr:hypothetical protein [Halorhodospira sp. 9622]MCG5537368.1 hypothetical protein [Halorhodospira sp. 9622]
MRAVLFATLLTIAAPSIAGEQVGRYSSLDAGPTDAELEPLKTSVQVTFPQEVTTVGDALEHLLEPSGYEFLELSATPVLTSRPLPEAHREIGPMPLQEALKTLGGAPWRLLIDPVARAVTYEPKPPYREGAEANAERLAADRDDPEDPRTLGPIARGASLYQIAAYVAPRHPKVASQALYEANPQAFIGGDPNLLIAGAKLEIPDTEEIEAGDPDKAESWFGEVTQ